MRFFPLQAQAGEHVVRGVDIALFAVKPFHALERAVALHVVDVVDANERLQRPPQCPARRWRCSRGIDALKAHLAVRVDVEYLHRLPANGAVQPQHAVLRLLVVVGEHALQAPPAAPRRRRRRPRARRTCSRCNCWRSAPGIRKRGGGWACSRRPSRGGGCRFGHRKYACSRVRRAMAPASAADIGQYALFCHRIVLTGQGWPCPSCAGGGASKAPPPRSAWRRWCGCPDPGSRRESCRAGPAGIRSRRTRARCLGCAPGR